MMGDWYSASFQDGSAESLWHMFWEFHDFRLMSISHRSADDCVEAVLEYDDRKLRVMLRFEGDVSFSCALSYLDDRWISGSTIHEVQGQIQWTNCEPYEIEPDDDFNNLTFVRGNILKWTVLDECGRPGPVPHNILHQDYQVLNTETGEYEDQHCDYMAVSVRRVEQGK